MNTNLNNPGMENPILSSSTVYVCGSKINY